jgi:hypothetical protein
MAQLVQRRAAGTSIENVQLWPIAEAVELPSALSAIFQECV